MGTLPAQSQVAHLLAEIQLQPLLPMEAGLMLLAAAAEPVEVRALLAALVAAVAHPTLHLLEARHSTVWALTQQPVEAE